MIDSFFLNPYSGGEVHRILHNSFYPSVVAFEVLIEYAITLILLEVVFCKCNPYILGMESFCIFNIKYWGIVHVMLGNNFFVYTLSMGCILLIFPILVSKALNRLGFR